MFTGDFMERIQKLIASSGYCSRRKAEDLIVKGKVKLNGKIITELGTKASSKDEILIDGNVIASEEKEYYLLNKPMGVIATTKDEKGRKTVIDIINTKKRIYPVGRLDYNTTGALILTNDGELANLIMHPRNSVEKVYLARVSGIIKGEQIVKLKKGVIYEGALLKAIKVKVREVNRKSGTSLVELTIVDGKNHEVKNMFEVLGYKVRKLKRTRIAFIDLTDLKEGEYRPLKPKEVKRLYGEL